MKLSWKVRSIKKHRKNCKCCLVSLLIVKSQRLSSIQVLNCQCLKGHKFSRLSFTSPLLLSLSWSLSLSLCWLGLVSLSLRTNVWKVTSLKGRSLNVFFQISLSLSLCWSGHVFLSFWSKVSKVKSPVLQVFSKCHCHCQCLCHCQYLCHCQNCKLCKKIWKIVQSCQRL